MSDFLARYGSPDTVRKLLSVPENYHLAEHAVKNPTLDSESLMIIHTDARHPSARHMAVMHKNFTTDMLDSIDHKQYKQAIAMNPNTSAKTLEKLHNHLNFEDETMGKRHSYVRELITKHPNLPEHMQEKFLNYSRGTPERNNILSNPKLNTDIIKKHWNSMHHGNHATFVDSSDATDILKNPNTPSDVIRNAKEQHYTEALIHPNLPDDLKRAAISGESHFDRAMVSGNPSLTKKEFDECLYHNHAAGEDAKEEGWKMSQVAMEKHYPRGYDSRNNSFKPYL